MRKPNDAGARRAEAGFSLMELMVALGVTLVIMVVASRMLAMSMAVRTRENQRSEAIADTQRALQAMTREISNAGLGLANNGLVDADSDDKSIRVRSNLNAFCATTTACDTDASDPGEDVIFAVISRVDETGVEQWLVTRQDRNSSDAISPLANRIDELEFEYFKSDGTAAAAPSQAQKVKITVSVTLKAVGSAGAPGYQPPTRMHLASEALLRNSLLDL